MIAKCPTCHGEGFGPNFELCEECNGVGQIVLPRPVEPTRRQYLLGALICAAVAAALILMFASKL